MKTQVSQLILSNIRNLEAVDLNFGPRFNVFIGPNGGGKTSLLEAIHLLSVGRSFRARTIQQIISFGEDRCLVRARVKSSADLVGGDVWLGVSRGVNGDAQYKIGESTEKSSSELTKYLPVQLIDVNSPQLLEGGPNYRRQFVDWGVFHVEHAFLDSWRLMRRALEQRNAALKKKQRPLAVWDDAFIAHAMAVDSARSEYVSQFIAIFSKMLLEIMNISNVEVHYHRGWSKARDLKEDLLATANMDLICGYTNRGPHRADLEVLLDGRQVKSVLSRGQLKTFVCIMLLARAKLLGDMRTGIFLIDDLHAELDKVNCGLFISAIKSLDCQVFITGVEADLLKARMHGCETKMFHVEQGCIKELQDN